MDYFGGGVADLPEGFGEASGFRVPGIDRDVVLSGSLTKENPGIIRITAFQDRHIIIFDDQIHWWYTEDLALTRGLAASRGCVDFSISEVELQVDAQVETQFSLKPIDIEGWKKQRLTGTAVGRVLTFDTTGSLLGRKEWVAAIRGCLSRTVLKRVSLRSGAAASRTSFPSSPKDEKGKHRRKDFVSRKRKSGNVFDTEGMKLAGIKALGEPSVDAVFECNSAQVLIGDMATRQSPEKMREHNIKRVVDCLEPGAFAHIIREEFDDIEYLEFPIALWEEIPGNRKDEGIAKILAPLLGFVAEAIEKGESVMVHCYAGAHRAGTAGILSVMHLQGLGVDEAIEAVQAKRKVVEPLANMAKLLGRFEKVRGKEVVHEAIAEAKKQGWVPACDGVFTDEVLQDE